MKVRVISAVKQIQEIQESSTSESVAMADVRRMVEDLKQSLDEFKVTTATKRSQETIPTSVPLPTGDKDVDSQTKTNTATHDPEASVAPVDAAEFARMLQNSDVQKRQESNSTQNVPAAAGSGDASLIRELYNMWKSMRQPATPSDSDRSTFQQQHMNLLNNPSQHQANGGFHVPTSTMLNSTQPFALLSVPTQQHEQSAIVSYQPTAQMQQMFVDSRNAMPQLAAGFQQTIGTPQAIGVLQPQQLMGIPQPHSIPHGGRVVYFAMQQPY